MRRDRVWLSVTLFACAVLLASAVPARAQTVKGKTGNGFKFCTSKLTRWRSAVRARTGLPFSSTTCGPGFGGMVVFVSWFVT
jgi:hypothetical protein